MIKHLALFTGLGLAYSGFPADSAAQELISPTAYTVSIPTAEMAQETFIPPQAIQNHNGPSFGGPVVVLPVPLPAGGTSGSNNTYGFQYPGSYIPRDTPLHRFNGYIVCDPPNTVSGANGRTTSEPIDAPIARRMVKITATRSLAAPGSLQPCPIYTINGEIQKNNDYTTRSSR
jgi:hypothetical protein